MILSVAYLTDIPYAVSCGSRSSLGVINISLYGMRNTSDAEAMNSM